ncbi:hypothetical protein CB1_000875046 [Camelus ferus]|nr:hypothetical protein CB1_000875046 [Camelus ferus]
MGLIPQCGLRIRTHSLGTLIGYLVEHSWGVEGGTVGTEVSPGAAPGALRCVAVFVNLVCASSPAVTIFSLLPPHSLTPAILSNLLFTLWTLGFCISVLLETPLAIVKQDKLGKKTIAKFLKAPSEILSELSALTVRRDGPALETRQRLAPNKKLDWWSNVVMGFPI